MGEPITNERDARYQQQVAEQDTTKNALGTVERQRTEIAHPQGPPIDYAADAGDLGFGQQDLVVPFIRILQSNSPQLARGNAKYIPSARAGDFYNTVTQDVFSGEEGIYVLPIVFQRSYTEWTPRNEGGGLVADHGSDASILRECSRDDKNRYWTQRGTIVQEAGHYFSFQVDVATGQYTMAVIPFTSTQWKKARTWNTLMSGMMVKTPQGMKPLPMFANVYHLTTVGESNDSGDWLGYKIRRYKPVHEVAGGVELYEAARSFKALVQQGSVKAGGHEGDEPGGVEPGEGQAAPRRPDRPDIGDDIPF